MEVEAFWWNFERKVKVDSNLSEPGSKEQEKSLLERLLEVQVCIIYAVPLARLMRAGTSSDVTGRRDFLADDLRQARFRLTALRKQLARRRKRRWEIRSTTPNGRSGDNFLNSLIGHWNVQN